MDNVQPGSVQVSGLISEYQRRKAEIEDYASGLKALGHPDCDKSPEARAAMSKDKRACVNSLAYELTGRVVGLEAWLMTWVRPVTVADTDEITIADRDAQRGE